MEQAHYTIQSRESTGRLSRGGEDQKRPEGLLMQGKCMLSQEGVWQEINILQNNIVDE